MYEYTISMETITFYNNNTHRVIKHLITITMDTILLLKL